MEFNFEWDPLKAASNKRKHGVTFKQAIGVFKDPMALTIFDDTHSTNHDERWITMGQAGNQVYLLVVHTYQDDEGVINIRVISARQANKSEIRQYQQGD